MARPKASSSQIVIPSCPAGEEKAGQEVASILWNETSDHPRVKRLDGTLSDLVLDGDALTVAGLSGNPFVDLPATPDAFDDEFSSGSPDLSERGYTIKTAGGTTLTRPSGSAGNIQPWDTTGPTGNTYWSQIIGSWLFVQPPVSTQIFIYKSITLAAGDTYFCRVGSPYRFDSSGAGKYQEVGFYAASGGNPDPNNRVYVSIYETATNMNQDMQRVTGGAFAGTSRAIYNSHDIRGVRWASGTSFFPFTADSSNGQALINSPAGAINGSSVAFFNITLTQGAGGTTPQVIGIDFIRKKTGNAWIVSQ